MNDVIVIGIDEAIRRIKNVPAVLSRTLCSSAVLKEVGAVMAASGKRTITAGGRPVKYKPLAASTLAARARKGKASGKPLVFLGTLRSSLDFEVERSQLYLTSVDYLKYHQFEEGRAKALFPARPVWGAHEKDKRDISKIILGNLSKKL